jgi:hypothetical protein
MYLHFLGYKNNLWKDSNAYLKIDTNLLSPHPPCGKDLLIDESGFHVLGKNGINA